MDGSSDAHLSARDTLVRAGDLLRRETRPNVDTVEASSVSPRMRAYAVFT